MEERPALGHFRGLPWVIVKNRGYWLTGQIQGISGGDRVTVNIRAYRR